MGNYTMSSKYDSKSSIVDNIMNTDNLKLNKILQIRYNNNFLEEIEKLLENFNINTCDKEGKNLLHIFANEPTDIKILKIILDKGCDINKKDNLGNTPIYYSNSDNVKFYIENGADLNIENNQGRTVLYQKSKDYYFSMIIVHLFNAQNYENIYEQFSKHELLHKAVLFKDIPKMKELMNANKFLVNTLIKDPIESKQYLTPLSVACINNLYDEFLCLIEHGADIHQNNLLFNMQYHSKNIINIIKKLIELGIDINQMNDEGNVLHQLQFSSNVELIEIFLKAGVNVHATKISVTFPTPDYLRYTQKVFSNATPLQSLSTCNTNIEVYKKLFEYGADPNIQNNYGINAFMGICSNEFFTLNRDRTDTSFEMIQLFVENGADIYLIDNFGNTVLDIIVNNPYITKENKTKIIKYLHEKFKLTPTKSKTNEFLYNVLVQDKIIE